MLRPFGTSVRLLLSEPRRLGPADSVLWLAIVG